MPAAETKATARPPKLVTMVVAAGRTVQEGNPVRYETITRMVNGKEKELTLQVPTGAVTTYSEGSEIRLPEDEAKRLYDLGFVKKPNEAHTRPFGITAQLVENEPEATES